MSFWRLIRDTSKMNKEGKHRTENLHSAHEIAAWPDFWVLRGGGAVLGNALDIVQHVRFQQAFAEVKDTGELRHLDTRDFLRRTATAFGWSLKQLRQQLNTNYLALEFLGIHDEELAILDTMLVENLT